MGEEGDRGILWRGGRWELFSIAVLSLSFPSAPSCFFRLEEGAGQGCSGGETGEEGMGGSLTECRGPMGKVRTLASPSPADVDSPPQPGRFILGVCGSSSGLSPAFLPDSALNVGRALQKEAWAGSQLD